MKKLAQAAFVIILSLSWAMAQETKNTSTSYQPAVVVEATPTPSPSPSVTPTPEIIERYIAVPVMVQQSIKQTVVASMPQQQSQQAQTPKSLVDEARRLVQQESIKVMTAGQAVSKEMSAIATDGGGGGYSGGLVRPTFVLETNKGNFEAGDTLQTKLRVVENMRRGQVYRFMISLDGNTFSFRNIGTRSFVVGETIPIQTYVWEGSEARGLYIYGVFVTDSNGQIMAEAVGNFVFGNFMQNTNQGYVHIDSAESIGGQYGWTWLHLHGNFFPANFDPRFHQYIEVNGVMYNVAYATNSDAWVPVNVSPGVYDITLIAHFEGNVSYDSVTAPSVLKIFPTFTSVGGKG